MFSTLRNLLHKIDVVRNLNHFLSYCRSISTPKWNVSTIIQILFKIFLFKLLSTTRWIVSIVYINSFSYCTQVNFENKIKHSFYIHKNSIMKLSIIFINLSFLAKLISTTKWNVSNIYKYVYILIFFSSK